MLQKNNSKCKGCKFWSNTSTLFNYLFLMEKNEDTCKTRLNMMFIHTLLVKVEFTAILRMLSNAKNAKQRLGEFRGAIYILNEYEKTHRRRWFLELPWAEARQLKNDRTGDTIDVMKG